MIFPTKLSSGAISNENAEKERCEKEKGDKSYQRKTKPIFNRPREQLK